MSTLEIRRHWKRVGELRCMVSESPYITIHHCHGGSMLQFDAPGMGQKQDDWLVIPLHAQFHTGHYGIDTGMGAFKSVTEWELYFGTQVSMLEQVSQALGLNVFEKAGLAWPLDLSG